MATAEDGAIAVIGADRRELAGLLKRCSGVRALPLGLDFAAEAALNGRRLLVAANGPGPELAGAATRALFEREPVRLVISAGTCGALAPELAFGDIFVADQVRGAERKFDTWAVEAPAGCRRGVLLSVDRVVVNKQEKAALFRQGAAAVDMESAGVAPEAERRGVPVAAIRVVLDVAAESFPVDFNTMRGRDGRFSPGALLRAALARPFSTGGELLRLRGRLRLAAERLGDFLAGLRF